MTLLQPPPIPAFTPYADVVTALNGLVRDPLTYLLAPPVARLRRTGALNLTESQHQWIAWDTEDEDTYGGWTAPVVVGGGGNTTLNGATTANANTFTVVSATGFAIGDIVRVDTGANAEYRPITGIAGLVITVPNLSLAHASGVAAVEVSSDPTKYFAMAPGWYGVTTTVSLSGTGAANLIIVPSLAVNGGSQTGFAGGAGWEGNELFVPQGASTQPKVASSYHEVYCNLGDALQLDLVYSVESAITAASIVAGEECSMKLVWKGM